MTEPTSSPLRNRLRSELRSDAETRPESSVDLAKIRAREILEGTNGSIDDGSDKFYIDPGSIPQGWTYEWKTRTVYNQENPAYQVALARTGWEPVPLSRHPEMMPLGHPGHTIERDGQVLMQRPQEITDMVIRRDKQRARDQVKIKETEISGAPQGQFARDNKGTPLANVKKGYAPITVPD